MRKTNETFITQANILHNGLYDYSNVKYINATTRVFITCKVHGDFSQTPTKHLIGRGCAKCKKMKNGYAKRLNNYSFIKKANIVHSNKYDYSNVEYNTSQDKVSILCKIHGEFKQYAKHHLAGHGCKLCQNEFLSKIGGKRAVGWKVNSWIVASEKSKRFDSFKVYIIKCWNDNEEFFKVGRTFLSIKNRFLGQYNMPYNYEIIKEFIFDNAKEAYDKEIELKRINVKNKYLPHITFNGKYECFKTISI